MPIDPNIALGIRPIEQPNVLGQMAQMMAIRQAQQEYAGTNALRDAFASGGDFNDPAFRQRVREANPKMAFDLEAKHLAGEKTRSELEAAAYKNSREALTMVNSPESLRAYAVSQFNNPVIGPRLKAIGLTPEIALANLDKEIATLGFNTVLKKSAMGLDSFFKDETSRANAATSAAPGNRQASVAEQKLAMEKAQQDEISRILRGEPPTAPAAAPTTFGGGGVAPSGGVAPVAAPTAGVAPIAGGTPMPVATAVQPNVNALNAPPAAPVAGNVNALTAGAVPPEIAKMQTQISQLISTGSPKAIAAADALIKQHNMLMPSRQIVQNEKGAYNAIDQRTGASTPVLDAGGKPLVGKLPPEQFESSYKQVVGKAKGDRDVGMVTAATAATDNLPKLYETLDQLKTSDAITGFGADIIKNIEAAKAKFTGDIKAGKKVADTQILDAMLGSDVFPMIQSLGIGARGMDTPAEREYIRGVMTGTINMDKAALIKLTEIRKNIEERAINTYNRNVDNGTLNKFFETEGRAPQKIETPVYTPKTTAPQAGGSVRVSLPDGRSVTLPNAEAAAKFKKDAGIQ
jgi:hypothetical protein